MTTQINTRSDLGDRHGPQSDCQAAAEFYRDKLGWKCGADARSVWLQLVTGRAALVASLATTERVLARLAEAGPVIAHPGKGGWCVLLVRAATSADQPQVAALADRKVGYLAPGRLVDLPPTRFDPEDGPLTWKNAPEHDQEWPTFAAVVRALLEE